MSWSTPESLQRTSFKCIYLTVSMLGTPSTRNSVEGVARGVHCAVSKGKDRLHVHVRMYFEFDINGLRIAGILSPVLLPTNLAFCISVVFYIRLLVKYLRFAVCCR